LLVDFRREQDEDLSPNIIQGDIQYCNSQTRLKVSSEAYEEAYINKMIGRLIER